MLDEEKIQFIIFTYYVNLFFLIFFNVRTLVQDYCNKSKIPFDLPLSIISIGFGNSLTLIITLIIITFIFFLINKLFKLINCILLK